MSMLIDVQGYDMVGEDTISGDSFKDYPPTDLMPPYGLYPVGVNAGAYDLCCIAWVVADNTIKSGIIRVTPKA